MRYGGCIDFKNGSSIESGLCHYCKGDYTWFKDYLGNYVCKLCWHEVQDCIGRWGDLRTYKRECTPEEKKLPRGEWK